MRRLALLAAAALAATGLSSAANATLPATCGGSLGIPNPDAIGCVGYYDQNVFNSTDNQLQQDAVNALLGSVGLPGITVNFAALDASVSPNFTINSLTNTNQLNFGTTLSGYTIIGAHFGNVPDTLFNPNGTGQIGNVSVFWLFNLPAPTDHISLDNTSGWSNAVLYSTQPGGVPEPATWAMMLIGFGAAGVAMRRGRRQPKALAQLA